MKQASKGRAEVAPENHPGATAEYIIRSVVDGVDQLAIELERKWGVDRLRLLVGDDLRARFARA